MGTNWNFYSDCPRSFPRWQDLLFNLIFQTFCKKSIGRERQKALYCYFCSLEWFNCWWVGDCGVEKKAFFRDGWNCIFCVSGFIQGWGTQGESKLPSFFHLFSIFFLSIFPFSDVSKVNEGSGRVQDFLAWLQGWRDSP